MLAAIQFYFGEPKTAICFGETERMNKEQFIWMRLAGGAQHQRCDSTGAKAQSRYKVSLHEQLH